MPSSRENAPSATAPRRSTQGSNGQRSGTKGPGGRIARKGTNADQDVLQAELESLKAQLADANKKLEVQGPAPAEEEPITRMERPKGEAGDRKNGFVLQDAMGLGDTPNEDEMYRAILRTVHFNVARANLDVEADFGHQDPAKLASIFKLTRKEHPYLTQRRFPLDWTTAEMVKQYLRNKRRYGVRCGFIADRKTRKRGHEDSGSAGGAQKRRKTGPTRHIDEEEDEGNEDGVEGDKGIADDADDRNTNTDPR
ncbi:hypothetical protein B0H10DRAFT_2445960 [Mycena sp. CBHHK59/15]|nr:hypothetical protein B0H10DRAFT_2445960 [Mycena sp. CBHHK59/15]